ncbi:LamG domain-containing protein [Verrucomicrobiota bacterium]
MKAEVSTSRLVIIIAVITVFVLLSVGVAFVAFDFRSCLASLADRWVAPIPDATDSDHFREIATYKDLWMNGYLGTFLRFKWFGYLNWLAIPLLIRFIATVRRRQRWEMALVFVLVLSSIVIGIKGYENYRYALTITPFITTAVLYEMWNMSRRRPARYFIIGCLSLLVLSSFYLRHGLYRYYLTESLWTLQTHLPSRVTSYLNETRLNDDHRVLILDQSWPYYYIDQRLINVKHPEVMRILGMRKRSQSLDKLMNQLNIHYVITDKSSKMLFQGSRIRYVFDILKKNSTLIVADDSCRLYRLWLGMTAGEIASASRFRSLIMNGTMKNWPEGPIGVPTCWQVQAGSAAPRIEREDGATRTGRYCAKVTGDDYCLFQTLATPEKYRGKKVTCFAWLKTSVPDKYSIRIHDGISESASGAHPGDGAWHLFQVTHEVSPKADRVEASAIYAAPTGTVNDVVYVDAVLVKEGEYIDLMAMAQNAMRNVIMDLNLSELVTEGSRTYAISGTGRKASIEGPARLVEGPAKGSRALVINETTRLTGPVSGINLSEGSLAVWARLSDPVKTYSDLIRVNNDNDLYLYIYRQGDNGALIAFYNNVRIGSAAVAVSDHQWHHYAFTWRHGEQKLYVDGCEQLAGHVPASSAETENLAIGWLGNRDGEQWSGAMAEFITFDRVLTPKEIMAIYRVDLARASK